MGVYIDHKGKRKAKCIGTSKRAAEVVAGKIEARLALGQSEILEDDVKPVLFADYTRQWLRTYAAIQCKPVTVEHYEAVCRLHIFPALEQNSSHLSRENGQTADSRED